MSSKLELELSELSVPGKLYRQLETMPDRIQCTACGHYCKIKSGNSGICKIRFNENGILRVPHNYVAAFQCDPIEKKPFFHAFPKSLAMSVGMLGCDFHCSFCQNWDISQAIRDPAAGRSVRKISAIDVVNTAIKLEARSVVSTYNEPLITSEWAVEIFKEAKKQNLATGYVSNGHATPEVLDFLKPHIDLYNIDLKTFQEKNYKKLGGNLENVLDTIKGVYDRKIWLEVITLVVPGFNDSKEELSQIAEFIYNVSPDIPWHITAYRPMYKMNEGRATNSNDLLEAAKIGEKVGLHYIYAGNIPGRVGKWEDTKCPSCNKTVVERKGYEVFNYSISTDGKCKECSHPIAGRWEEPKERKSMFYFLR
ncbi:MAG: AmmeMemoRadiSam system radical SAM enzyme [Candidatus Kariarchaeaceae archaeon]|jgi:pyruvate formate lyase activating enzyme